MNNGMFKEYKFPTPCGEKCFITDIYKNTRHCKSVSVPLWGAMFHNDAVSTYKPVVLFPSPYGEKCFITLGFETRINTGSPGPFAAESENMPLF